MPRSFIVGVFKRFEANENKFLIEYFVLMMIEFMQEKKYKYDYVKKLSTLD